MLGFLRSIAILMQFISYLSLSFAVLLKLPWRWQICIASLSIFLAAAAYFTACDPLPPAKSKIRQWLGNLAKSIKISVIFPMNYLIAMNAIFGGENYNLCFN